MQCNAKQEEGSYLESKGYVMSWKHLPDVDLGNYFWHAEKTKAHF